jgi:hypothetical protein
VRNSLAQHAAEPGSRFALPLRELGWAAKCWVRSETHESRRDDRCSHPDMDHNEIGSKLGFTENSDPGLKPETSTGSLEAALKRRSTRKEALLYRQC